MKRQRNGWAALLLLGVGAASVGAASACGDAGFAGGSEGPGRDSDPSTGGGGGASPRLPPGELDPDGGADIPPETEIERSFDLPRAGDRFVYVANPVRDSVTVIDSLTLRIESVEAGEGPTYLETFPDGDQAIVLNVGSADATILRTDETQTRTATLPTVPGVNAIAMAPDGAHAVVYFDATLQGGLGTGSFQDVSLLTLADGEERAVNLSVGFRPSSVQFSADGQRGFVITEDGVSVLDFASITGPSIAPTIPIGDGPSDAVSSDVSITGSGRYAIARREGEASLRLVDLDSGAITALDAGSPVTDLDLIPGQETALAVLRGESAVLRIPIPAGFEDPGAVERFELPGEFVGSAVVSPDGRRAVLYTTALTIERVSILDLPASSVRTIRLRKVVRAVAIAPDSRSAIVVHEPSMPDPANGEVEAEIDRAEGYTLLSLDSGFAKLQLTPTRVGPLAIAPGGEFAMLLLRNDASNVREVHRVDLGSFVVQRIPLGSPPISIGSLGTSGRAFVGQRHPEGRITFIEWQTGETISATGYELNSRIVE